MRGRYFYYLVVAVYAVGILFPLYWLVTTSFKTHLETFELPPVWAFIPTLDHYKEVFLMRNFNPYLINSTIAAAASSIVAALVGCVAAYSFSRFRIKRSDDIMYFLLSTKMLPPVAVVIPMFVFMRFFGLVNSILSLVVLYTAMNLPFAVWMMKGFFDALPKEPEESALIDGCSQWRAFIKIVLPQVVGGLFATFIFVFIYAWNEFMFALVLTYTNVSQTVPVWAAGGLTTYRGIRWGEAGVVGTITIIPVLIFAMFVRKYLIRGITFGMIKG